MDSGKQSEPVSQNIGPRSSTKENMRPLEDSTIPGYTDIQDDENQTGATQEDTPTDGLHKIGEPPSQGVGDTLREFKLVQQRTASRPDRRAAAGTQSDYQESGYIPAKYI